MAKMTKSDIEAMAIEYLQGMGYEYVYGPDIEPSGINPLHSYQQVILEDRVCTALQRLNPHLNEQKCEETLEQMMQISTPDLTANNLAFHRLLTEGINIEVSKDGNTQGELACLIDFNDSVSNEFLVINQLTIKEGNHTRRPDLTLFINGLPLVVIELKNATDENATVPGAYNRIKTYQNQIPSLFTYNASNVISDRLEAKAGTVSADFSRYMTWKTANNKTPTTSTQPQLKALLQGLLNPITLLDVIRHFIVFEANKHENNKGIISVRTVRKMAAYHQYYAVSAAVLSTTRTSAVNADSPSAEAALCLQGRNSKDFVNTQKTGDRKVGVVWHIQGSGKSLSMAFHTGKIVLALNNSAVVVITDRNDLDDQLFGTFSSATQLPRRTPKQANNREELKEYLRVASGGVVFITTRKSQPDDGGNIYELPSDRTNIVVIIDEAHRSQYGFSAKEVDARDSGGNVAGKRTVYGFAKYIRDALPNATYLGFTGTPIEKADVNTPTAFGNCVDIYDISQAVEDGATVRIFYESRFAKITISDEGRQLIEDFDDEFNGDELTLIQKEQSKWARIEGLIGSSKRIGAIAADMVQHFEQRLESNADHGKSMIVAMSRRIAAKLYQEIIELKPEWHSDDLNDGMIKVVMISSTADGPEIAKHHATKKERQVLANRMKDDDDKLKLMIVRDMWLTGFDAPSMHALYIDKSMRGRNLMQAITRVNRVHKDRIDGLAVDYLDIASDLKEALSFYSDAGGHGDPAEVQEEVIVLIQEKLGILEGMMYGYDYKAYSTATTSQRLAIILESKNRILELDSGRGKMRFLAAVAAMSQAFVLATPHDKAMEAAPEVAFFQAVKARLSKFTENSDGSEEEHNDSLEVRVKQTMDQVLVTDKVVDIFGAAGIQKPDISVLSEEFLQEMKNCQHRNIALETLKKLLSGGIKVRSNQSITQGRKLTDMLTSATNGYQSKVLTVAEVIDELIKLVKATQESDSLASRLNLSAYEYAFHSAVADNGSARKLMEKEKLRELAVILTEAIRNNVSLDWIVEEAARVKIRVVVKRLLKKYGYSPDVSLLTTETTLKQAELLARELEK